MGEKFINSSDFILVPTILLIIYIISMRHQKKMEQEYSYYSYYQKGLFVKLFSAIIFCFVYVYYYGGGDTINYFRGAKSLVLLWGRSFPQYLEIFFGKLDEITYGYFCMEYGPPWYMWKDPKTFVVCRLMSPIVLFTFQSYLAATLLLAWISYAGVWRLFRFFLHFYPQLQKELAFATLFVPSVVFWGSGILKDTFTFAATCWFIFSAFKIIIIREKILINVLILITMGWVLIAIKPYIFVALLPGTTLWIFFNRIKAIKSPIFRVLAVPFILALFMGIAVIVFSNVENQLGEYGNMDKMLKKAQTTQEDLSREEQYGSNSYSLGKIEWTPTGIIKSAPLALVAGLYRPFIWEARSVVLFISGLENLILLALTIWLIFKSGVLSFFRYLFSEPIVMFCTVFSWFFLFFVGLSTANFGALVRYKIPAIPFFIVSLFIVQYLYKTKRGK